MVYTVELTALPWLIGVSGLIAARMGRTGYADRAAPFDRGALPVHYIWCSVDRKNESLERRNSGRCKVRLNVASNVIRIDFASAVFTA